MAWLEGCGANKPFKEFDDLTYSSTGLGTQGVNILDGGYCVDNGYCYVKIKLHSNSVSSGMTIISQLPKPTDFADGDIHCITSPTELKEWNDAFKIGQPFVRLNTSTAVNYGRLRAGGAISNNVEFWVYCKYKC